MLVPMDPVDPKIEIFLATRETLTGRRPPPRHLVNWSHHIQAHDRQCKQIAVEAVQKPTMPRNERATVLDAKIAFQR